MSDVCAKFKENLSVALGETSLFSCLPWQVDLARRASSISAYRRVSVSDDAKMEGDISPHSKEEADHFKLNLGGKSFCFRSDVILTCREDSLLSTLIRATHTQRLMVMDSYNEDTGEYYLERNVKVAESVIDYFVTGKLHKPHDVCPERFTEELQYWRLYDVQFAPCCGFIMGPAVKDRKEEEHEFDGVVCSPFRLMIYRMMEDPSHSFVSKFFAFISISFIFASILGLILGSMPEFQTNTTYADGYHVYHLKQRYRYLYGKFDEGHGAMNLETYNLTGYVYRPTDSPMQSLVTLEYFCILWFTIEFLVRFLVAPRKKKFVSRAMNLVDLFTILPVYFEVCLSLIGIQAEKLKEVTGAMLVMRVLRVLRMARVFKLARYSTGLQIFGNTLRASMTELSMLLIFLITGTVFFSTIMYFLEKDEPYSDFSSIPAACWWCIITITTVGFGDCHVQTTLGKIVATATSITGIIILAFPVSLIVENFAHAQHQALVESQIKHAQMSSLANNYVMKRGQSRRVRKGESIKERNRVSLLPGDITSVA
ncbi:unnamed protein product [Bursaphelenchus xylophilus]|uniref:(pine wood nematode) hypothetical protein n=1 Tax=Bursaphelenchus xylophilus TaxID=6326 RepID=A0A811LV06_BURXY|nr:unnamed protein product [Bursaphelenchus xylophilus]CAG9121980.1 unnamed protein product [Bursaphelenchus xylophilus]